MAINLSSLASNSQTNTLGSLEFHGLRRDADGMLIYTIEDVLSTATIDVKKQPAPGVFPAFDGDYVEAIPSGRAKNPNGDLNDPNDKYQQYKITAQKIRYFIDDDGYLVARLNNNYSYNTIGPK